MEEYIEEVLESQDLDYEDDDVLDEWAEGLAAQEQEAKQSQGDAHGAGEDEGILDLMRRVGRAVGALHAIGVCSRELVLRLWWCGLLRLWLPLAGRTPQLPRARSA